MARGASTAPRCITKIKGVCQMSDSKMLGVQTEPSAPVAEPSAAELDATYLDRLAQHYTEPAPVENLTAVVNLYVRAQQTQAGKMLAAPDHGLDSVRYKALAVVPLVDAFDAQQATIDSGRTGPYATLTERGHQQQSAVITENRQAAIHARLTPLREELKTLEAKATEQIALGRNRVTDADRDAATELAYRVTVLAPGQALLEITRWVGEAIGAQDMGRAVSVLPFLKSLMADARYTANTGVVSEVAGLIAHVEAVSTTWKSLTAAARLERINRLHWELDALTAAAQQRGQVQAWVKNTPGWQAITAPPPVARDSDGKFTNKGDKTFRRVKLSPE